MLVLLKKVLREGQGQSMDSFKIVMGILCSFHTGIIVDYLIRFRPGLPEKYVLKKDYERRLDQLNAENKEGHKLIFQKLDEITKSQNLILIELAKKADRV